MYYYTTPLYIKYVQVIVQLLLPHNAQKFPIFWLFELLLIVDLIADSTSNTNELKSKVFKQHSKRTWKKLLIKLIFVYIFSFDCYNIFIWNVYENGYLLILN